jgi:hypothetical protein
MEKLFNIITEWETDWLREKVVLQSSTPYILKALQLHYNYI